MEKCQLHILTICSDKDECVVNDTLVSEIEHWDCHPEWATTYETALAAMIDNKYEIFLIDYHLNQQNGLKLLSEALSQGCQGSILLLINQQEQAVGVEALKIGATDYLVKSQLNVTLLEHAIRYALDRKQTELEREQLLAAERQQRQLAETLSRIGLALNSTLDLTRLLDLICQESIALFQVDDAFLWLVQGNKLIGFAGYGQGIKKFIGLQFPLIGTESLGQRVIQKRRPIFINNLDTSHQISQKLTNLFHTKAILGVPLLKNDEAVGALMIIDTRHTQRFDETDAKVGVILGNYAAIAIQNAQRFEAEKKQRKIAESLQKTGLTLSGTLELESVLDRLLDQIAGVVPYDSANVTLVENGVTRIIRMQGYEQFGNQVVQCVTNLSFNIKSVPNLHRLVETRQPVVISNTAIYPGWVNDDEGSHFISSWVGVPILLQGEVIAFFSLDKTEPGFYQTKHVERLAIFARQASLAWENARLFKAEAQRRHEAETLQKAIAALTSSFDLDQVLDTILIQLEQVVPYNSACVFLHQDDWLYVMASRGFSNPEQVVEQRYPVTNDALYQEIRRSQQPLCLSDAQTDPRFKCWGNTKHIHGWLGIPLIVRQNIIGCLSLDSRHIDAYGQAEMNLGQTFATQAAIAITNAQLFEQLQIVLVETEGLYQIGRTLIGSESLPNILQIVADKVAETLPATWIRLVTLDIEARRQKDIVTSGPNIKITSSGTFDELMAGLTGWVVQEMKPALSPKTLMPDSRESPIVQQHRAENQFGSIIVVPLHYREKILGTMTAINAVDEQDFTKQDVKLMVAMANQVAITLENIHLFQEAQEAHQLSDSLREIGASLAATLDPNEVLNRILDNLGRVVPFDSASAMFIEEGRPRIKAQRGLPKENSALSLNLQTVSHQFLQNKEPLIIPDIRRNPHWRTIESNDHIRYRLGIPLVVRNEVIGMLNLNHTQVDFYTEEHAAIGKTFAQQAAIALENAHLFDETYHRAQQLAILNELANEMTGLLEVESLCTTVAQQLYSVFGYYNVAIFTVDLSTQHLVIQTNVGAYTNIAQSDKNQMTMGERIIGKAAETGELLLANDAQNHPDFFDIKGMDTRSELAIPLKVGKQLIGVMCIDSDQLNAFDGSDVSALTTVADQLAVAMEKARLFEATNRRVIELEAVRQASLSLTSSLEFQDVLEAILESALKLLVEAHIAHIFLYQNEHLTFGVAMEADGPRDHPIANPRLHGLTYTVARQGKPLIIPDMNAHPLYNDSPYDWQGAIAGLPLKIGHHVVGVMTISSQKAWIWSESELHALHLLADQAAVAIENTRLFEAERTARKQAEALREEAKQNLAQITRLYELSAEFVSALSMEEVANLVIEKVVQATKAHSAVLNLLDELGNFEQSFNSDEPPPRPLGNTMTIYKTGQPLVIGDIEQTPESVPSHLLKMGIKASVGLPLKTREQAVGVLFVRYDQSRQFSQQEVETLFIFANQAAIAIQNARLYEKVQRYTTELEARVEERTFKLQSLYELTLILSQVTQLEDVIRLTLLQLQQTMPHDISAGLLITNTTNILMLQSQYTLLPTVETQIQQELVKTFGELHNLPIDENALEIHRIQPETTSYLSSSLEDIKSSEVIPLLIGETVVGLLWVATREESHFDEEQMRLLYIIANQTAETVGRLQSLLAAEYQRLENLVAYLPSGIIMLDSEQRIILANETVKKLMSSLTSAQIGDKLTALGQHTIEKMLASPDETPFVIKPKKLPNQIFEVTAQPITQGPEIGGSTFVIRDVTEEHIIQKRIHQQERMAAVGQLAAGIAHDFNNILTGIIGYSELLSLDSSLSSLAKKDVERIINQAQRAAHLVRQILDFSRQTITEKQSLDLILFIKETIKLLERTIPENIHITLDADPGEYVIKADVTQMQQALTNLALNARDAMPGGGKLTFGLSRLTLKPQEESPHPDMTPGLWIILTVSDIGIGIPPELHGQIFEPFFTTKEVGKGTGLGLAQVYGIVIQHEGHIDIKSQAEHGAAFTLYLPALPVSQMSPSQAMMVDIPRGHDEVILLAEDDPSVLIVSTTMLKQLGYRVLTARNGLEALKIYKQHQGEIELVLTDLTMPKMGGVELALALRQQNPNIKVIAITGYPLKQEAKELLRQGIVDWLQKPFNLKDLAQMVNRFLNLKTKAL